MQPDNLLVNVRTGNVKLSGFGRAGLWDPKVGDASDLSYAPSGTPLQHSAPEVRMVPPFGKVYIREGSLVVRAEAKNSAAAPCVGLTVKAG